MAISLPPPVGSSTAAVTSFIPLVVCLLHLSRHFFLNAASAYVTIILAAAAVSQNQHSDAGLPLLISPGHLLAAVCTS